MANQFMTGTTCGNEEIVTFIANGTDVEEEKIYQLSDGRCITLTSVGEETTQSQTNWFPYGPFDDCEECLAPFSASTGGVNGEVCVICDDELKTITPPKPVYTNEYNKSVEQINAIVIGGNGLNS